MVLQAPEAVRTQEGPLLLAKRAGYGCGMKRIIQFQVVTDTTAQGPKRLIFALDEEGRLWEASLTETDRNTPLNPQWSALGVAKPLGG